MRVANEQLCDTGNDVTICYETFGDRSNPPLVLIMGLGMQMIAWPDDFCQEIADAGFFVIRHDNRDAGRSTHFPGPAPTVRQLLIRRFGATQYRLEDMADDTARLLQKLDLAPTHIVGASMGGMIAQMVASRHPVATRSLVSIMSSPGGRHGRPALAIFPVLLGSAPDNKEAFVERALTVFSKIGSKGFPQDLDFVRYRAETAYERDTDRAASARQLAAIRASGDRTGALRTITAPTLVIHGTVDPMVTPSGGRATAKAIRGAKLMMVEGMGHDLPRAAWSQIIGAIGDHCHGADAQPTDEALEQAS